MTITVGNGGLIVNDGATFDIGASTLIISGTSGLNTNSQTGRIISNKGNITINSSSASDSHLDNLMVVGMM
ncbi:MAG: hypothetical protein U5K79_19190 [Cyclobacteriaceae bacterium]|nr:hypothetical protein [Cyclobacteriaceae bacterium]